MQASPREEEQRRGAGRADEEQRPGEEVQPGATPEGPPGLEVWVVTHRDWTNDLMIVGVAASAARGREMCDEDWANDHPMATPLQWDDQGPYYFSNGRRRDAGYDIEPYTVV